MSKPANVRELTRVTQCLLARPQPVAPDGMQHQASNGENDQSQAVFVVDDDDAVREAIGDLLHQNGYVVELFADGAAFFDTYRPGGGGCLLVDALMPGMSGIEVIERLKGEGHDLPAIVITGNGAAPLAVQAMKAGAIDFIEKPVHHHELLDCIARALDQGQDTAKSSATQAAALRVASLTPRQRQILELVLAGHPSKNIAADLGISQRTVDNHRAAIMKKTNSKSIPALIRTALSAA